MSESDTKVDFTIEGLRRGALRTARLANRNVVVIGAGTRPSPEPEAPVGNGRAIAILSMLEGAKTLCVDRDLEAAQETVDLAAKDGGTGIALWADASTEEGCERVREAVVKDLGKVHGLVICPGAIIGRKIADTSANDWDVAFNINVRAHFLVCRALLPLMDEPSSVVFYSSMAGQKPGSFSPAYDAAKAAVGGLCRHLALEGSRRGVRANVVAPGLIDTPLGRDATRGRPNRTKAPIPLGREGSPWEVAETALFLLSDDSSYVTGQTLLVDGGLSNLV